VRQQDHKFAVSPTQDGGQAETGPTVPEAREKPGVLVVDDEHLVRVVLQLGLERDGFAVWMASNGREAIRMCRKHRARIGVVLLDVCMPGLDGPATLDALHQFDPEVVVCFMSGDTGAYEMEELRRRGARSVIAKPFPLHELTEALRLLVQGTTADLGLPSGGQPG
jgi:CheY-like chemotaxis protein